MIDIILGVIVVILILAHTYTVNKMQEEIKFLAKLVKATSIDEFVASEEKALSEEKEVTEDIVPLNALSDEEYKKIVLKNNG